MRTCPICEQGNLQARSYSRTMLHKGINITAEGLLCDYCEDCGVEMTSPLQLDQNAKVIRKAFIVERERIKREQDMLTGAEIRRVRELLGITQKQASKIFGGGPTAFAKYEAEDVVQSVGMDKLLRLAFEVPAAADWLLERSGEVDGRAYAEHPLRFTTQDIYSNIFSVQRTKTPDWFAEDVTTKHGQFDLRNAVFSSCNDGAYSDAA